MRARFPAAAVACALAFLFASAGTTAALDRTLWMYNIHTKETMKILYKKDGEYIPEAMKKINWFMRDWRKNKATTMEPRLIDLLWEMHAELGSKEPIHLISGFRSLKTNNMLRRTRGGQAKRSRHILGRAADVHFPDVPLRLMRYSALVRERGGVGYYPTSAIPFVHVDIDRVRAWPRLPRAELALLFPKGRTKHLPRDGKPITPADVRAARANHRELAVRIAKFRDYRDRPRSSPPVRTAAQTPKQPSNPAVHTVAHTPKQPSSPPVQTAALMPGLPLPKLLSPPRPARRPAPSTTKEPDGARPEPAALTAEPPRLLDPPAPAEREPEVYREPAVVAAPAYDEEHPEELSYRPFPIAPLLTATASVDDPALAVLRHPDLDRVLELLDQEETIPPMRLRPGVYEAERMWAAASKGVALDLSVLSDARGARPPQPSRKVATHAR